MGAAANISCIHRYCCYFVVLALHLSASVKCVCALQWKRRIKIGNAGKNISARKVLNSCYQFLLLVTFRKRRRGRFTAVFSHLCSSNMIIDTSFHQYYQSLIHSLISAKLNSFFVFFSSLHNAHLNWGEGPVLRRAGYLLIWCMVLRLETLS